MTAYKWKLEYQYKNQDIRFEREYTDYSKLEHELSVVKSWGLNGYKIYSENWITGKWEWFIAIGHMV